MNKRFAFIIVLDVVFFGGWIAQNEYKARVGDEVLLPVRGYDPRDLLSGHYVRFRLVAESQASELVDRNRSGPMPFCIEKADDERWNVTQQGTCEVFIMGDVDRGTVHFPVDRFYVDEARANEVLSFSESKDTFVRARVDADGGVRLLDLVVNGKSFSGR
jgi:uncharacterized membrane-anchored protein